MLTYKEYLEHWENNGTDIIINGEFFGMRADFRPMTENQFVRLRRYPREVVLNIDIVSAARIIKNNIAMRR